VTPPDTVVGSAQRRINSFPKECQRKFSSEDGHIKITKRYLLYFNIHITVMHNQYFSVWATGFSSHVRPSSDPVSYKEYKDLNIYFTCILMTTPGNGLCLRSMDNELC
jgi:hypothetical protein